MAESAREIVNDIKATGKQMMDQSKSAINDAKSDFRTELSNRFETVKGKAQDAITTSEDFVKEHPLSTVLGACAIGFVAGLIARRRRQ